MSDCGVPSTSLIACKVHAQVCTCNNCSSASTFESRKRDAHCGKAGHAKQPSTTLNATVRPSSEGATSKEANGIVCATD